MECQPVPQQSRRLGDALRASEPVRLELQHRRADGSSYWVELDVSPVVRDDGQVGHFVTVQREVGRRRAEQVELREQALHDHLTGLLNRRGLLRLLETSLRPGSPPAALLLADVAGLRRINASLGREAGDEVMRTVGQRVRQVVGALGAVGRLESGEFVVVTTDHDLPKLISLCERLRRSVVPPVRVAERELGVTLGLGLAVAQAGTTPAQLLREGDLALRAAKERGQGQYELYDEQMGRAVKRRLELEGDLRRALSSSELTLHYQPVVSLADASLHHAEALLRWFRDGAPVAGPAEFVPVAEDSGLIVPLGGRALHRACAQAAEWQQRLPGVGVAVNLSPRQLREPSLLSEVDRALDCGLPHDLVTLEVTESALLDDPRAASSTLRALRRRGLHLALDDFGTGYSSLAYLSRLPVDSVKIDKSFVDGVDHDAGSRAVIRAVVAMAGDVGLAVVAEGIEERSQCEALQELGVDLGQGYLFARPVPVEALTAPPEVTIQPVG